ncbi:GNAT family N-acetyltransferase [Nocardia crassostreae]|uniref:GNAT family N-acetyltransferase n=1 Tax=Nocardia crassostreae TaxID=53428 RepID=UPI000B2179E3|nr:GNAT family N-acetyltransferase [Nocardia crassostreae]
MRILSDDDWKLWRRLRLEALAEAPYAFGSRLEDWQGEGDREERWRDRLSIPGSRNLIAMLDQEPVGMASGVPGSEAGVAELISMWVAPIGRGLGVGDRLIRTVEEWAAETGTRTLCLAVVPDNAPALALYRRNGFEVTGELIDDIEDGRLELVMTKSVDPASR